MFSLVKLQVRSYVYYLSFLTDWYVLTVFTAIVLFT